MFAAKARVRGWRLAVTALFGVLCGAVASAQQPAGTKSETERLLSQKAMMLEIYLGSQRVTQALKGGDKKSIEVVERARAELAEGAKALETGDLKRAEQSLDAGLRQVSTLVLRQGARAEDPATKKKSFESRRRQITSFLRALEAGSDETSLSPWVGRLAVARNGLKHADKLFEQKKYVEADAQIVSVYEDVVVIVSEARRNQSVTYRLDFQTPADEYAYELERNKSYEILVDIAIAEKRRPDKALRPYIRKLVGQSQALRKKAEAQAASGDHVTAIATLEGATSHLVRALRSAGIMVME